MEQAQSAAHLIPPAITEANVSDYIRRPDGESSHVLSVAVVDGDPERRNAVAKTVGAVQAGEHLPKVSSLPWVGNPQVLVNQGFDVVFVAVDGDREVALETIRGLCRTGSVTPMAYSERSNDELLISCMRSGVRELLIYPFGPGVIEEAFNRMASRDRLTPDKRRGTGKSFVFLGAKGGSGVTTAACNFAVSLAKDSKRSTLLIDLDLPLGSAALNLGIANEFSTIDALKGAERLDTTFLMDLVVRHSSGLFVLAAPGKLIRVPPADQTIDKLMDVATQAFDYVVVDAGSRMDLIDTLLFDTASKIYLVMQVGIPELRNANRLIVGALEPHASKLEIVLNRYTAAMLAIGDEAIARALTRPAQWRIPNDYQAVRSMQNNAEPLALKESSIQRAIQSMAREASGLQLQQDHKKRKKIGLFGFALGA